jgi:hypothetical protein
MPHKTIRNHRLEVADVFHVHQEEFLDGSEHVAWAAEVEVPEMYGPPCDCKEKAKRRSTGLRKCIRPFCAEQILLATMSCAACLS